MRTWTELKLAETSGILPSLVSAHLRGKRPIPPQHLGAYLRVFDRQERAVLLHAWLRDNVSHEVIASLLNGTKTYSMPSLQENQCRMLDWWATAIARDFKAAKIFGRFTTKATLKSPLALLLPASSAVAQLQTWLLQNGSSVWHLVRSLGTCVKHASVGLVMVGLAWCQQGQVTQQPSEFAKRAGKMAKRTVATSRVVTSFVAPALADTRDFDFDSADKFAIAVRDSKRQR